MTIAEYVAHWLEIRKSDLAPSTIARYRTLARNQVLPHIGLVRLLELSPARLAHLYEELAKERGARGEYLQSATICRVHAFLHVCMEHATVSGVLTNNPVDRVKPPTIRLTRRSRTA